jgi:hypothetical protein
VSRSPVAASFGTQIVLQSLTLALAHARQCCVHEGVESIVNQILTAPGTLYATLVNQATATTWCELTDDAPGRAVATDVVTGDIRSRSHHRNLNAAREVASANSFDMVGAFVS